MNELSLFTGVGGGLLASRMLGWRTVCAVEKDSYCREVLLRRQSDGLLDLFPIWDDIKTFDGKPWRGRADLITAGFPCQPFSVAGKQRNKDDERNLWPETIRVIREVKPQFVFLENVPGLLSLGHGYFATVLGQLSAAGFDARWEVVSAAEAGALHRRERLFVFAYAMREGLSQRRQAGEPESAQQLSRSAIKRHSGAWWAAEPDVDRMAYGVAFRVDRIKAIGNGIVPQQMILAWELLTGEEPLYLG